MIICESCGCENDDQFKYCRKCGTPLESQEEESDEPPNINCPNCGMEQPANFKFCGACGEQIPDSMDPAAESGGGGSAPSSGGGSSPSGGSASQPGTHSAPDTGQQAYSQDAQSASPSRGSSPATGSRSVGRLVVIQPDGTEGASIDIPPDRITIGRDSHVDTLSEDYFLSPNHASISYRNGTFLLTDEESVNGIFREVVDQTRLSDGDRIRIGKELLEFETFPEPKGPNEEGTKIAGSPDPGYWGRLSLIVGPDMRTESHAIGGDRLVIGREKGDVLFQDDGFVSGTHAAVVREQNTPLLRDLDSSNGTFIKIEDEYELDPGEKILMGQQLFKLEA